MIIAITGASGSMGKETVRALMENIEKYSLRLMLFDDDKTRKFIKPFKKRYKKNLDKVEIFYGDIRNYEDCLKLTKDANYLMHMAALIPPMADHDEKRTIETNYNGTKNLVDSIIENGNTCKMIHISTVALYGNRNELHPWGRVGDPLLVSAFDTYGMSKLFGERYVLESNLKCYTILRQSGVLYDNILMNNISDGLMFHTCWNTPIEWATAKDSGNLMRNIILYDMKEECKDLWMNVFNIGGGKDLRETGYETFDNGFKIIGGSCKSFFKPGYNEIRNFHCFWYSDSDKLDNILHFRSDTAESFWKSFVDNHKIYKAGKLVPQKFIRKFAIDPLLKNDNSPYYWIKNGISPRVYAAYGKEMTLDDIEKDWNNFKLFKDSNDYERIKSSDEGFLLNHGYDETKNFDSLTIEDVRKAISYRGGTLLSDRMDSMKDKIVVKCDQGHTFTSTPFIILKTGHWCPECLKMNEWNFDKLSKNNDFYKQIWLDTHSESENKLYYFENGKPFMKDAD